MARKSLARKSAKSNKRKTGKRVAKKSASSSASRPSTSKKRVVRRQPPKKAPTKGKAVPKRAAPKKAPARHAPARMAGGRSASAPGGHSSKSAPGKAKPHAKGARPAGQQGTLEFEVGPQVPASPASPAAPAAGPPDHLPKRRSSKQGGPDWPGENLTVGMPAPDFELPSTLGRKVTLHEFRGKRVILYFYPKDDTPGCTMEACAFRDNLPRIEAKDAVVLGISLDDELSHQRFAQKYNLPFPLLADVDAGVCRRYGVYKEKNMYGRSFWGIERTTFVIDREGKVENVFRRVKVEGHADEVLATLAV